MVVNNDVILDKKLLVEMLNTFKVDEKVGIVSPKIYFAKDFEFHQKMYSEKDRGSVIWCAGGKIDWDNVYGINRGVDELDVGQYNHTAQIGFATGTCVLVSREVIEKVGMFDKKYYLYYEDTDLSVKAKKAGYKIMYQPDAVVWHKVSQSSGIGSDLNDYFIHRNRLLFGFRYATNKTKLALIRESMKFLLIGRYWQKKGVRDYYLRRFGKGSWK